jgi:hypothetical protein
LVRSTGLGFLGAGRFAAKTPDYVGWISLDFLGFPWILSSESRLFNGLRGIKRGSFFFAPFARWEDGPGRWRAGGAVRKRRIVHGASLI